QPHRSRRRPSAGTPRQSIRGDMLPQRRRARIASPACPVPPETAAHARSSIACTNARNNSIALDDYWPWTPDIKKDVRKVRSRLLGSVLFWRQCGHLSSHAANDPPHIANPTPRVSQADLRGQAKAGRRGLGESPQAQRSGTEILCASTSPWQTAL